MADEKPKEKTLEMRVAELEDKLSKVHITEEEMKAYQKVASLIGSASPQAGCVVDCSGGCINECAIRACTITRFCTVTRFCTIIRACTFECGGGCAPGGGSFGGGFGSLGG
ncbi:MAG: hypothetical protein AB7N65_27030 [Vicinamibacterales bacterium]